MPTKPLFSRFIKGKKKDQDCQKKIAATIDLHGYTKSQGISTLTQFLDQVKTKNRHEGNSELWVQVITGSGAHSGGGPVLRDAVQTLLQKRQMAFTLNPGRGSFFVQVNSGYELYNAQPPSDTKVIVQEAPQKVPALPKRNFANNNSSLQSSSNSLTVDTSGRAAAHGPLPAEVRANDLNFEESRKEKARLEQERKREGDMIEEALQRSISETKYEGEEDETMLLQAMSLSMMEMENEEEHELQCDPDLQEALRESQKEFSDHQEEVDSELKEAMQMSRRESTREDAQWMEILEASRREFEQQVEDEDKQLEDSLKQAVALSMKPSPANS